MAKIESWDLDDPLGRVKGETGRSNRALQDYVDMGPGRSLKGLIKGYKGLVEAEEPNYALFAQFTVQMQYEPGTIPPTKTLSTVARWSSECQWQARIACYEKLQRDHREAIRAQRRDRVEDADWDTGGLLRSVAGEFLLEFPKFLTQSVQTIENDDGEQTDVVTVKVNTTLAHISQALKVGSDLQRLSTNEPTNITELHGAALISRLSSAMDEYAEASQVSDNVGHDGSGTEGPATDGGGEDEGDQGEGAVPGTGGVQKASGSALS
jgi:hypothetical protein